MHIFIVCLHMYVNTMKIEKQLLKNYIEKCFELATFVS